MYSLALHKCVFTCFIIVDYYRLFTIAVDYDWLWDNVVQDLDINKMSGQWDASYAKFSGFRCLNIYFETNQNRSVDTKIRVGEKKILDHFLMKRIEPLGNSERKLGALYRTYRYNGSERIYHWFVLDVVYDRYFVAYQEFNRNSSQDFWAIYTRPDRECGNDIVDKANRLLENVKIQKTTAGNDNTNNNNNNNNNRRLLHKVEQTKNCAEEIKQIERTLHYLYYFSSADSFQAIHIN